MKIAIPDLISNSYFPVIAAVELGLFKREGLDVELELVVPVEKALAALDDGSLEFIGCSSHLVVGGFPEWRGAKLLCAQAQGMYWFLVIRSDLKAARGDLNIVKGRRIGAAHWVGMALRQLLAEFGIDPERDRVQIAPIPGAHGVGASFGVMAAQALEEGRVDGFWANGMGAELAVRRGVGTVVLDARRDPGVPDYTMAAMAASDRLIAEAPEVAAAAVRAVVAAQRALKENVALARRIGEKLFPQTEAELIADLIQRDLPFYSAAISRDVIERMIGFSRVAGILKRHPAYEEVVATQFEPLWSGRPSGF
jgi:ABC-type nitrate/sulfonate/bicarbonate transport system substrate-binding protein